MSSIPPQHMYPYNSLIFPLTDQAPLKKIIFLQALITYDNQWYPQQTAVTPKQYFFSLIAVQMPQLYTFFPWHLTQYESYNICTMSHKIHHLLSLSSTADGHGQEYSFSSDTDTLQSVMKTVFPGASLHESDALRLLSSRQET